MSLVGAGMCLNPIWSHFCWLSPSWWKLKCLSQSCCI